MTLLVVLVEPSGATYFTVSLSVLTAPLSECVTVLEAEDVDVCTGAGVGASTVRVVSVVVLYDDCAKAGAVSRARTAADVKNRFITIPLEFASLEPKSFAVERAVIGPH
jgi:hypothetical protein